MFRSSVKFGDIASSRSDSRRSVPAAIYEVPGLRGSLRPLAGRLRRKDSEAFEQPGRESRIPRPPSPSRSGPLSRASSPGSHPSPNLLPRKAKPPPAQVPRLIGVVKTVNREDRFVLIDATTFQGAEAGDLLVCVRDQKETANLRMSTLKNPPFLIADIASGAPSPGDRVLKP